MHALLSMTGLLLLFPAAVFQGIALVKIWLAFGHEGETFPRIVRALSNRWVARLARARDGLAARVLGRRKAIVGSGAMAIMTGFNARARVQFGALPAGSKAALVELDRRTKELMSRFSDENERREDEATAIRREIDELRVKIARDVEDLRDRDRRVATHGLAWELGGWLAPCLPWSSRLPQPSSPPDSSRSNRLAHSREFVPAGVPAGSSRALAEEAPDAAARTGRQQTGIVGG